MIKRFRKNPEYAEAIKYTGENQKEIASFCEFIYHSVNRDNDLSVKTPDDLIVLKVGDYVIKEKNEYRKISEKDLYSKYEEIK